MKNAISNLQGKIVKVTMRGLAGAETVFTGKVVDYTTSHTQAIWVERLEDGEWVGVNLSNPHINTVEEIVEVEADRYTSREMEMKDAHKALDKEFKWVDEDIKLSVKVYDCFEDQQSYDVEIQWAIGEDTYTDCVVVDSFYSNIEGDEVAEKDAVTRAKTVLRTVKGWFKNHDLVTVVDGVEVYHA